MFLDRYRIVGAAFDRRVVGQEDHLFPVHHADAGHDTGRCYLAIVHFPCCQGTQLEERGVGVHQSVDPLPGQQLASAAVQLHRQFAAAGARMSQAFFQVLHQGLHAGLVVRKVWV